MATLSPADREDLQAFLKDWLRHAGRTQADLRRALQATSIRMPVLLELLEHTLSQQGLAGLAEQLCSIEDRWQAEDRSAEAGRPVAGLHDSLGQLDLLLQEIRGDGQL